MAHRGDAPGYFRNGGIFKFVVHANNVFLPIVMWVLTSWILLRRTALSGSTQSQSEEGVEAAGQRLKAAVIREFKRSFGVQAGGSEDAGGGP